MAEDDLNATYSEQLKDDDNTEDVNAQDNQVGEFENEDPIVEDEGEIPIENIVSDETENIEHGGTEIETEGDGLHETLINEVIEETEETIEGSVTPAEVADETVEEAIATGEAIDEVLEGAVEDTIATGEVVDEVIEGTVEQTLAPGTVAGELVTETVEEATATGEVIQEAIEETVEEAITIGDVIEETVTEAVEEAFRAEDIINEAIAKAVEHSIKLRRKEKSESKVGIVEPTDEQRVSRAITRLMSDTHVNITGDFAVREISDEDVTLQAESAFSLLELSSEESVVEVLVEGIEGEDEEEVYVPIDREKYIEMHKNLIQERFVLRRKNGVLQRKLVEHFKKRRMDSALKEVDSKGVDLEQKYFKKLYGYEVVKQVQDKERFMINTILKEMKEERDQIVEELENALDSLIERERLVGTGLINTKTGKPIPDRLVERLLNRQRSKAKEVGEVRLVYIKLRDKLAAKDAALRALETLGEGLHLIDYEQLRVENQSYGDKIEERDEELARLRTKATSSIQILAHVREKANATAVDIDNVTDQLEQIETDVNNERENVARLKRRRDYLREETLRLRREAGLLTHTRLLRDFEESIEETTRASVQLQNLKNTFHDQKRSLASVRKSINFALTSNTSAWNTGSIDEVKHASKKKLHAHKKPREDMRMGSIHRGRP